MMPRETMTVLFRATAAVAISLLAAPAVFAQAYPVKPVRIVVSWPPGGSNDVVARVMAQRLTEALGQAFVVENRAGATGTIGSDIVAKSTPDGYTVLINSATHIANAHIYKNLPYDTMRDLTGVMPLAVQIGMLVVHPSLPVKSVKELIALARSRPDQIAWASTGTGSYTWLTMAQLLQMTGTKIQEGAGSSRLDKNPGRAGARPDAHDTGGVRRAAEIGLRQVREDYPFDRRTDALSCGGTNIPRRSP